MREQLHQASLMQEILFESSAEKLGFSFLDALGVSYEKQHPIKSKFIVDALIPHVKVVLEFDGDYWHGNPTLYKTPDARQIRQMKRDAARDTYLGSCGYRVVRIWESDLKRNADAVKSRLCSILMVSQ